MGDNTCVSGGGVLHNLTKKEFSAWFQGLQAPATDFSKKLESMAAMPMSHRFFSLKMKREREGWATSTSTITWGQLQSDFRLVSAWSQELQAPATDFSKKLESMVSGVGLGWGGKPDCPNFWFLEKKLDFMLSGVVGQAKPNNSCLGSQAASPLNGASVQRPCPWNNWPSVIWNFSLLFEF